MICVLSIKPVEILEIMENSEKQSLPEQIKRIFNTIYIFPCLLTTDKKFFEDAKRYFLDCKEKIEEGKAFAKKSGSELIIEISFVVKSKNNFEKSSIFFTVNVVEGIVCNHDEEEAKEMIDSLLKAAQTFFTKNLPEDEIVWDPPFEEYKEELYKQERIGDTEMTLNDYVVY